jgi:hypothetical protein
VNDESENPMENEEFPVDPPIVDYLYFNAELVSYVITFIPEDSVSQQEKESVIVPEKSDLGYRVRVRLAEIEKVLGEKISRLLHAGDGNFAFIFPDGRQKQLSDATGSSSQSQFIYDQLQDLGMTAQIAFLDKSHLPKNQAG